MGCIHSGILLCHKKEWNSAICTNMDGPRDCHTKWVSDTEKQISYAITHMWSLKNWYKWTYLQNRNRVTKVERKLKVRKVREGEMRRLGLPYPHQYTKNR